MLRYVLRRPLGPWPAGPGFSTRSSSGRTLLHRPDRFIPLVHPVHGPDGQSRRRDRYRPRNAMLSSAMRLFTPTRGCAAAGERLEWRGAILTLSAEASTTTRRGDASTRASPSTPAAIGSDDRTSKLVAVHCRQPRARDTPPGVWSATSSARSAELVALQTTGGVSRARGWRQWTATSFEVRSSEPIAAGVDGEALVLASPLRVVVLASALRVRIAPRHSRRSPAAAHPRVGVNSLIALLNIAFRGR